MTPSLPLDLSSLQNALASLRRALTRWQAAGEQDEELRDACIQRFEYTFELSWKMLQRRLERDLPDAQSVDAMSFRELMRSKRWCLICCNAGCPTSAPWRLVRGWPAGRLAAAPSLTLTWTLRCGGCAPRMLLPWRVDLSDACDLPAPLLELVERHGTPLQDKSQAGI